MWTNWAPEGEELSGCVGMEKLDSRAEGSTFILVGLVHPHFLSGDLHACCAAKYVNFLLDAFQASFFRKVIPSRLTTFCEMAKAV